MRKKQFNEFRALLILACLSINKYSVGVPHCWRRLTHRKLVWDQLLLGGSGRGEGDCIVQVASDIGVQMKR